MFHPHWREQALASLDDTFDLIVIGGGVNGAGILLDAAQRGLRVLLLERLDIGAGTSSRSSQLIHGGLRYLKRMQFRITRLACRERDRLLELSPHLVWPIRFLYPVMGEGLPGWQVDLGLWMYDRLTRRAEKHAHPDVAHIGRMAPGLPVERVTSAMVYTDAVTDDARLTLAIAATGFAYGGLVLTRAEVVGAVRGADGRIGGVVVTDRETGRTHRVRCHVVVNATGVWVDQLRSAVGISGQRVRPSRGSHVLLRTARLPLAAAVTVPSPDDGRPVFFVPHPEGILVGTTDLFHEGPLDDPRPTPDEVQYLLRALQAHFPTAALTERDVVGAYAGLRPILDIHADTPSAASRDEDVWEEAGMLSVSGGKLTTWRVTAEEAVDAALEQLPEERARRAGACLTKGTPLAGLAPPDLAARLAREYPLTPTVADALARRLGAVAWLAPRLARGDAELTPLVDGSDLSAAEVRAHIAFGAASGPDDVLLRRARVGVWDPPLARAVLPRLRPLFQQELGWERSRWDAEETRAMTALAGWTPLARG